MTREIDWWESLPMDSRSVMEKMLQQIVWPGTCELPMRSENLAMKVTQNWGTTADVSLFDNMSPSNQSTG